MNRYDLDTERYGLSQGMIGHPEGDYVYYDDAMEEIERLRIENAKLRRLNPDLTGYVNGYADAMEDAPDPVFSDADAAFMVEMGRKEIEKLRKEIDRLRAVLERASNGLQWWRENFPNGASGSDDEMLAEIKAVLEANQSQSTPLR